ncbi:MAG: dipeptidyl-peptidase 5 [Acidimicrobiales bacterium]
MPLTAPYGSWESPISLDLLVEDALRLYYPLAAGDDLYWVEMRPEQGGRQVIVRQSGSAARSGAAPEDVTLPPYSARALVHEYGGIPYAVFGEIVYFSNQDDQRLYRLSPSTSPEPITGDTPDARSVRYAAPVCSRDGRHLFAVRERHLEQAEAARVLNDVVVVPTDGSKEPRAVASGHDFYSHLVASPDGSKLAWVSWDHPNMPWDATQLWEATIGDDLTLVHERLVAGSGAESVIQPKYSPTGELHFISDRSGWWNLYRDRGAERGAGTAPGAVAIAPMEADLGLPDWVFGRSSYAFLADGRIVAAWSDRGLDTLGVLPTGASAFMPVETGFTSFDYLGTAGTDGGAVIGIAGSPVTAREVVWIEPSLPGSDTGPRVEVLRPSREVDSNTAACISVPEVVEFPTESGLTAHGLYYPPFNPSFQAPRDELPPLIVQIHGGPTAAALPVLDYEIQFWTSRGIGVVDVNYRGSTGYGRAYRDALKGKWGIAEVDDCVNAARFLSESGRADPSRLLIHGSSAGGYTTLCAVTFREVFAGGASYFGISDASALAEESHKFEARYMDSLIGPWPEAREIYRQRSPLFHLDRLRTPLILFQGLEDKVVLPNQAGEMAAALEQEGVPYAYIAFPDEGHGFRHPENLKRAAAAELYFYGRLLGFVPADDLAPVTIENEENLAR